MNRRGFFGLLAGSAVAAAVPEIWTPNKTIFLPPAGGWVGRNQLLTIDLIVKESLRVLHQNMEFVSLVNRQYDPSFATNTIDMRGRVTVGSKPWRLA